MLLVTVLDAGTVGAATGLGTIGGATGAAESFEKQKFISIQFIKKKFLLNLSLYSVTLNDNTTSILPLKIMK